ncbi:MAG: hypothetical protein WB510_12835, partial [Candidatus Sulfotelmatobacter sp.]
MKVLHVFSGEGRGGPLAQCLTRRTIPIRDLDLSTKTLAQGKIQGLPHQHSALFIQQEKSRILLPQHPAQVGRDRGEGLLHIPVRCQYSAHVE